MDEQDFIKFITIKKGLSVNSIKCCRIRFTIIKNWLVENNRELNKESVEEFFYSLKQRGLNNNSLNTYLFTFRYIRDYLEDRGKPNNFLEGFKAFVKVKPNIIILTPEEITKLLNVHLTYGKFHGKDSSILDFIYPTLIMFLAFTGCRFDEAASLKLKYLDLAAGRVSFVQTKNKDNRNAYITEPLISRIKELIKNKSQDDFVFTNLMGKKVHAQDFICDLKRRVKASGITKRVHPHLFRHSFATQLLIEGVDLTMVASLLGHKDIQTTFANYVHLADESLKKATYRHPLVRINIDPHEILKNVRDTIHSLRLEKDQRFEYRLEEDQNSLVFRVVIKTACPEKPDNQTPMSLPIT